MNRDFPFGSCTPGRATNVSLLPWLNVLGYLRERPNKEPGHTGALLFQQWHAARTNHPSPDLRGNGPLPSWSRSAPQGERGRPLTPVADHRRTEQQPEAVAPQVFPVKSGVGRGPSAGRDAGFGPSSTRVTQRPPASILAPCVCLIVRKVPTAGDERISCRVHEHPTGQRSRPENAAVPGHGGFGAGIGVATHGSVDHTP